MTKFDLFDSIGNVDDELIEKAVKPKMNSTNMRLFLITGSIAACAVIAVTVVFFTSGNNTTLETSVPSIGGYTEKGAEISSDITTGGANSEIPHTEESYDTDVEIITSDIFYVKEGKIEKMPVEHEATPQAVFELWKTMNNIGDEVKLLSVKIESNGITEESVIDGRGVATYHVGTDLTLNLTITKNIENYYSRTSKSLLLDSLERTMYQSSEIKYGELNLILEEG